MSKKFKDKGRIGGPFVPLLVDTMKTPAWRALSHGARSLFIALKSRYSSNYHNNGKLFLSMRDAAEELGANKNSIGRWYKELEHYGFIVQTAAGCLGVDGKGKAPHWRLTELGCMKDPPTREFERWDGTPFDPKKQNPVPKIRTGCPNPSDSCVLAVGTPTPGSVPLMRTYAKTACPTNRDISRLTTWGSNSGASETAPLPQSDAALSPTGAAPPSPSGEAPAISTSQLKAA